MPTRYTALNPEFLPADSGKNYPAGTKAYVGPGRENRLRTSWFVLGTVFGILIASMLQWVGHTEFSDEDNANETAWIVPSVLPEEVQTARSGAETVKQIVDTTAQMPLSSDSIAAQQAEMSSEEDEAEENSGHGVTQDNIRTVLMRQGDTLSLLLERENVDANSRQAIAQSMRAHFKPSRLQAGTKFQLYFDPEEKTRLLRMEINISVREKLAIQRDEDGHYVSALKAIPLSTKQRYAEASITSSLYVAADKSGIPGSVMGNMIEAYSYDVDFQREIKQGDRFEVLYESHYNPDGKHVGTGNLLYANLMLKGKERPIYYYEDGNGRSGFYARDGSSIRKALLKTPIPGARMSSGYGMRRHPILGYSKMHKGIDFAASTGTPIYAAGDGKISFVGRKGGYGNYIKIKHNGTYSTAYAHLHRFARGMKKGKWVNQGKVIGYVGSTGRSTGPHLHYEILKYGRQVNPKGIKFPTGKRLSGIELTRFKQQIADIHTQLAAARKDPDKLAMNE